MKPIRWLLGAVVVVGLILVGGSLLLPATTRVERAVHINQPPEQVFAALNSFKRFNEWSPWFEIDPSTEYSYAGPSAGVGARMSWVGSPAVGSGSQEILVSEAPHKIVNALDFGSSQAVGSYVLNADAQGTRVVWSLQSEHGYNPINRWFGALFLERMVGGDFEKGLGQLKALLEQTPG